MKSGLFMCFSTVSDSMGEKNNRHGPPLQNLEFNTNDFIWKTYSFMELTVWETTYSN